MLCFIPCEDYVAQVNFIRGKPLPWDDWVEGVLVKNGCIPVYYLTCVDEEILQLDCSHKF